MTFRSCSVCLGIPPASRSCTRCLRVSCALAQLLDVSQSAVSHQLRLLKASKLVKFRRDGKTVFYSLDDDHVRSMIALGMEHVEE